MRVRIRPATVNDADAMAAVRVRAWRAAYDGIVARSTLEGLSVDEWGREWRRLLARCPGGAQLTLVAEDGGRVVGLASGGPARDEGLHALVEVFTLYVDPDHWGHGAGRLLLGGLLDGLAQVGFSEAVLWVFEDNARGRAFYEADGWSPDGARHPTDFGSFRIPAVRYRRSID